MRKQNPTVYAKIILKPGKEESLKRFHPWVFSGAIARTEPLSKKNAVQEGDKVQVLSSTGQILGAGHVQIGSIAVRMLRFDEGAIDASFYEDRMEKALQLRKELCFPRKDNNCFRLVHGEGDVLPGLEVDVYGDTAVMQAHSVGMHVDREIIAQAILKTCGKFIKNVYYKSESTLPFNAGLEVKDGYLETSETTPETAPVAVENGIKFYPDWVQGQKTGFFVDQRENRALVEHYAKGKNVLNMFCYTGGFSLYALRGGAKLVHSVDASAKAVELCRRNVALNFGEAAKAHEAYAQDAFDYFHHLEQDPDAPRYNLMIVDPPAFAKHQKVLRQALQGYRKLNAAAIRNIAPGGILFTFSCSQAVSKEDFRLAVFSAAAQTGRKVQILHQLTQPADHPVNIYHPEGEYLKGLVLRVE